MKNKNEQQTRNNLFLYILLGILVGVTAFVIWVNVAKPPKILELRDNILSQLDVDNPFMDEGDVYIEPGDIPAEVKTLDAQTCATLDRLGAIVIRDSMTKLGSVVHLNDKTNSDEAMRLTGKLTYLNALNAVNANVTDAQTANWVNLDYLTSLNVQDNAEITSAALVNIAQMAMLDGVYLAGTSISGEGLEAILALDKVKILNLSGCKLTDADMAILGQLKSLHWLLIENMNLTDAALSHFMNMPNLKTVTIKKGNQITPEGAQKFMKEFSAKNGTNVDVN